MWNSKVMKNLLMGLNKKNYAIYMSFNISNMKAYERHTCGWKGWMIMTKKVIKTQVI